MATSEFAHPTSPTFGDTAFPPLPRLTPGKTTEVYLKELDSYLNDQFVGIMDMQASITQGWIVDGLRVINLTADNITANTIFTNDFYIGSDGNGSIEMSGTTTQLIIKDEAGTNRVIIGDFGASNTDWGIKVLDATGTVKFQSTSTTFIDGAIITNATITDSKIVDMDGNKVQTGTLPNTAVQSLSANKITLSGTLTCNSTATAIDVTSGGVVLLRNGADIIMRAAATGNTSYFSFQTSTQSERGSFSYNPTSNIFSINNANGSDLYLDATFGTGGDLVARGTNATLTSTSGSQIQLTANILMAPTSVVAIAGTLRSTLDNTNTLGTATIRWSDVRSVLINGADFCFENGYRITEPNHVYNDASSEEGLYFMNDRWEPIALLTRQGHLLIRGTIEKNWIFPRPDIPRRESPAEI